MVDRRVGRRGCRSGLGLLLLTGALTVSAQGLPGGGMGGMPGMGGDGPRSRSGGVKAPEHVPTLEELMPADPWRIWLEKLEQARTGLGLGDAALLAFDTFTHELRDAQEYNMRRVERAVRHRPPRISAVVDVGRDLREEAADAAEWQAALTDLLTRWQALRAVLSPAQQGALDALYTEAMTQARAMPAGAGRGPQPKD
ncbi:hypothetical protein [Ideonella sp. B508-1]|uniref:hypothetical protein n=1 Tax=Ideonella sp. B508-1 TaxID=137716 RepID=UPI0011D257A7|nr:hypothetical protein [Ideonella sp. B508-1]